MQISHLGPRASRPSTSCGLLRRYRGAAPERFDFQELELLLCGLPDIDVSDWMNNSEYTGDYERKGASHKVVKYFWEVVGEDFSQEQRARLLQFTTGTSGVPASGFAMLQGNDGNIRKFTVNSIQKSASIFPRHLLPNHRPAALRQQKELKKCLTLAIQMGAQTSTEDSDAAVSDACLLVHF